MESAKADLSKHDDPDSFPSLSAICMATYWYCSCITRSPHVSSVYYVTHSLSCIILIVNSVAWILYLCQTSTELYVCVCVPLPPYMLYKHIYLLTARREGSTTWHTTHTFVCLFTSSTSWKIWNKGDVNSSLPDTNSLPNVTIGKENSVNYASTIAFLSSTCHLVLGKEKSLSRRQVTVSVLPDARQSQSIPSVVVRREWHTRQSA